MSILSNLFRRKPQSPPVISVFISGIIKSMDEHSSDWSREGQLFVHAPTGMTITICSDGDGDWLECYLSENHLLECTHDESRALWKAYLLYLKDPTDRREADAKMRAAQRTRAYFDGLANSST